MRDKRGKLSFFSDNFFLKSNKGQVTIFIIVAILIVAAVVIFFAFRGSLSVKNLPAYAEPVYVDFLSCLEENTLTGADILGSQAGYIPLPDFEPGSAYSPFSSQLNFLGNPIPYWYYVSGNKGRWGSKPAVSKFKRKSKTTKKTNIMYTCETCGKSKYQKKGQRAGKVLQE